MAEFECPECLIDNEVDMPVSRLAEIEYKCQYCKTIMNIGWSCEIEVRSVNRHEGFSDDMEDQIFMIYNVQKEGR